MFQMPPQMRSELTRARAQELRAVARRDRFIQIARAQADVVATGSVTHHATRRWFGRRVARGQHLPIRLPR
jgi:hypothetical protein